MSPEASGSVKQEAVLRKLNRAQAKQKPPANVDLLLNPYANSSDPLGASR